MPIAAGSEPDVESAIVDVAGVTKRFGQTVALNSINLKVKTGEFFCFLGPSGCGKTTLLRMIAGFENPSEGKIFIGGVESTNVPPHKRPVNMVFQSYALFPHLTIAENVGFALNLRRVEKSAVNKQVNDALNLVRMGHLQDRLPSELSGGQQQRAALARAVVNNPSVLLLDEPLSALDPQIREEMQAELANLQKQLGMTFIMVTHDQNEALALSSRIAVFSGGKLEQIATPSAIFDSPKSIFVAKFIGQTNIIEAAIVGKEKNRYHLSAGQDISLFVEDDEHSYAVGQRVNILLKPHQIEANAVKFAQDSDNVFGARIVRRSFIGAATDFVVTIGEGTELRVTVPSTECGAAYAENNLTIYLPPTLCKLIPLEG